MMTILNKQYFKVYANCILVNGAKRAIICDLQKGTIHFIPLDLFAILSDFSKKPIEEIMDFYSDENREVVADYFKFLIEKELIYICNESELEQFPELDLIWDSPSVITNAIIDSNQSTCHDYHDIFCQLEMLGCKDIQLRFYNYISLEYLEEILRLLKLSSIKSIEIYLLYHESFKDERIIKLSEEHLRISFMIFHSAPLNRKLSIPNKTDILFTQNKISSSSHCGVIARRYFTVNIQLFTEAQHYNSCLNRKISIDVNGEIKNCPSMSVSYGNIQNVTLMSVIENCPAFKNYWFIKKDDVRICKDCEFRYICTDCRAYTQGNEIYGKPAKCKYDPYTATWQQ